MEKVKIFDELCKSCSFCVNVCPQKILRIGNETNAKGYKYVTVEAQDQCTGCKICTTICPDAAIEIFK